MSRETKVASRRDLSFAKRIGKIGQQAAELRGVGVHVEGVVGFPRTARPWPTQYFGLRKFRDQNCLIARNFFLVRAIEKCSDIRKLRLDERYL